GTPVRRPGHERAGQKRGTELRGHPDPRRSLSDHPPGRADEDSGAARHPRLREAPGGDAQSVLQPGCVQERDDNFPLQRERRQVSVRRLLKICLPAVTLLIAAASVWGFWSTQGTGTASATVGTLTPPTNVSVPANVSAGTVHVNWSGS